MPQQKGAERPDEAPAETSQVASELAGLSFEESLEKLEGVVDSLENGDLELEDSLQAFEQGVRLSARCSEQLASAEQRIETLTREGGNWVSRPFDPIEPAIETPTESATAGSSSAHGEEAS